jgi:aromatic ring-opening dioxygenase catalytic subunit (LigB family)
MYATRFLMQNSLECRHRPTSCARSRVTLPTYFIAHGGGPWPWMSGQMRAFHAPLEAALRDMPSQIASPPSAVLLVSAHWEAPEFTVMGQAKPGMLYDYNGFPPQTYAVQYDASGSPALADRVQQRALAAGMSCGIDSSRGFDHGAFVPMSVIYPDADVPVVQLSLKQGLDPQSHIALGRALAPLRDEGVLIIGSGMSFHNVGLRGPAAKTASREFDDWLAESLQRSTGADRAGRVARWADAPSGRLAHPREEHLLPLMVALGAAHGDPATRVHHEENFFGAAVVSSYRFDRTGATSLPIPTTVKPGEAS